jgi:hypothetical protein
MRPVDAVAEIRMMHPTNSFTIIHRKEKPPLLWLPVRIFTFYNDTAAKELVEPLRSLLLVLRGDVLRVQELEAEMEALVVMVTRQLEFRKSHTRAIWMNFPVLPLRILKVLYQTTRKTRDSCLKAKGQSHR